MKRVQKRQDLEVAEEKLEKKNISNIMLLGGAKGNKRYKVKLDSTKN